MDELETTNPAEAEAEAGVETEVQDEPQFDDDGNPIEDQAEDEEEIELDEDLKLKLPKSQAEKLRLAAMRQADYTRKTQELAEARKAFEAERQSTAHADEAELAARANVALIDRQLQNYAKVDWNAFNESDPFEAQKAFQNYQLLKDHRQNAITFLENAKAERTNRQQQEIAKRVEDARAELARDIPDWSPELSTQLVDFGIREFKLSRDDFDNVTDARAAKLLYWAKKGMDADRATKKAQAIAKQQEVTPAASVSRSKAPATGLDDRLPMAEWTRRREAELRKKAGQ